jgi:hypothetical protein
MAAFETKFGRWTFNTTTAALESEIAPGTQVTYQIPLEDMQNSAAILDWIYQVAEKTWASPADIGDLVHALEYIFGRGVCGGGVDNPIDAEGVLRKRFGIEKS